MEVHVPKPMYLQENHSLTGEDASHFLQSIALISFCNPLYFFYIWLNLVGGLNGGILTNHCYYMQNT